MRPSTIAALRTHILIAMSVVSTSACGGASGEAPVAATPQPVAAPRGPTHARGGGDVTAIVGEDGGELELGNGMKLAIPEGALSEPVEITMHVGNDASAFRNREDEQAIGQPARISPDLTANPGTHFTLSVPYTSLPNGFSEADAAIAVERPTHEREGVMDSLVSTRWDHLSARASGGRMSADVERLEGFRVQFVVSR